MLTVHFLPEPTAADSVVIVDVLRFTTSAAWALANGAASIISCATIDEARRHAGRALLAGERNAIKPDGFDLGNSPLEFTRERVQGRDIAWTTTNGTRAVALSTQPPAPTPAQSVAQPLPRSVSAGDITLASFVNLSAVLASLEHAVRGGQDVAIVCSGREGGFALEDAACAGRLVNLLRARLGDALTLNDGARAAACIDEAYGEDCARCFRDAQHGRTLRELGCGADLEACGALDALTVVPRWRDGRFVAG